MATEHTGKRYSAAFRNKPIQEWSVYDSARTSIVLARLLAEDAGAAEERNDYEAAYERYFASADALFRAVRALDSDQARSTCSFAPPSNGTEGCTGRVSERPGTSAGACPSEATLRTFCYRQIEALIARCEAIREYLFASTIAEEDVVDSSSDENSVVVVSLTDAQSAVTASKTRELPGAGGENVGPELQQRFEACRTMQEALERSRWTAWLMDTTAMPMIVRASREPTRTPLRELPCPAVASGNEPVLASMGSENKDQRNAVSFSGDTERPVREHCSSASVSETPSPSPNRVRRLQLESPSEHSLDATTKTVSSAIQRIARRMTPENSPIEWRLTSTLDRKITSHGDDTIILQKPGAADNQNQSSLQAFSSMSASPQNGASCSTTLTPISMDASRPHRDEANPSSPQDLHRDFEHVEPPAGLSQSTVGPGREEQNRTGASPGRDESHAGQSMGKCSPRCGRQTGSVTVSGSSSAFRSVLQESTSFDRPDPSSAIMDTASSGAAAGSLPRESNSPAAVFDARLMIQQELARRFQELRQRQQHQCRGEHPPNQVLGSHTSDERYPASQHKPGIFSGTLDDTAFDTTFSSGWHSNHSSISRSRYEAMKTRVALMKERLGKMMLAGNATAMIVMPATLQREAASPSRAGPSEVPSPRSMIPRSVSSSPSSLGAASNALQLSHAIVNLHAGTFGEFKRLEPLPVQAASRWSMEIDFLLSPCEQIVVRTPVQRQLADGTNVEVLENRLRPDIEEFLPRLRGMDQAIREMLRSFRELGGTLVYEAAGARGPQWWLDQPKVPHEGLPPGTRALLQRNFQEAADIRHLARDINERILRSIPCPAREYACSCFGSDLTETSSGWSLTPRRRSMVRVRDVLGSELHEALSKNPAFSAVAYARSVVLQLSADALLPSWIEVDGTNERLTQLVERLERAEFLYRLKIERLNQAGRFGAPWRREKLERYYAARRRCERGAHALREVFTGIGHTTRDQCAIRYNTDVGTAILEAYSRVLEHRAAAIVQRIRLCLDAEQQQRQQTVNEAARVSLRASGSRLEAGHSRRRDPAGSGDCRSHPGLLLGCSALERPRTLPNGLWAHGHRNRPLASGANACNAIEESNRPVSPSELAAARDGPRPPTATASTEFMTARLVERARPSPWIASGAETLPVRRTNQMTWTEDQSGSLLETATPGHRIAFQQAGRPPSWRPQSPAKGGTSGLM